MCICMRDTERAWELCYWVWRDLRKKIDKVRKSEERKNGDKISKIQIRKQQSSVKIEEIKIYFRKLN